MTDFLKVTISTGIKFTDIFKKTQEDTNMFGWVKVLLHVISRSSPCFGSSSCSLWEAEMLLPTPVTPKPPPPSYFTVLWRTLRYTPAPEQNNMKSKCGPLLHTLMTGTNFAI